MSDGATDTILLTAYVAPKDLLVVEGYPSSRQGRSTRAVQYPLERLQPAVVQRETARQGPKALYARQRENWQPHRAPGERQAWDIC